MNRLITCAALLAAGVLAASDAVGEISVMASREYVDRKVGPKRDKDDYKIYRKVKDCWTWTDWPNPDATASAPADFLAAANSPGSVPLEYRLGAWMYASQYWPNGKLKYDASWPPGSASSGDDLVLNFRFVARAEDGVTELYRFGATATRTNATSEALIDWFEDGPAGSAPVRLPTSDLVSMEISSATGGLRKVDGAARPLPKYLWLYEPDDPYLDDAKAWYTNYDHVVSGGCSALRKGGLLGRNFDFPYDERAEFVVKVPAADNRRASVGVSNLGTNLTEQFVVSGSPSPLYKVLPGVIVDGINDAGVVAEINVIPRDPTKDPQQGVDPQTGIDRQLSAFAVVRYVLDNFISAAEAAADVAAHYYIPAGSPNAYHWMIADKDGTYIVEDGQVVQPASTTDGCALVNFRVISAGAYDPAGGYATDPYGSGRARFVALTNAPSIQAGLAAVRYTHAYASGWPWPDEFAGASDAQGLIPHDNTERLLAYANDKVAPKLDPTTRLPKARGNGCWQTLHTSVYDITNRTLRVAVQEIDDWYVFAVPSAGGVKPDAVREIVQPMIADATNAVPRIVMGASEVRADLTAKVRSGWTDRWEPDVALNPNYRRVIWMEDTLWVVGWHYEDVHADMYIMFDGEQASNPDATELKFPDGTVTHRVPATAETQLLTRRDIAAPSTTADTNAVAGAKATGEALAAKRDKTDLSFAFHRWVWSSDDAPQDVVDLFNGDNGPQPYYEADGYMWRFPFWGKYCESHYDPTPDPDATHLNLGVQDTETEEYYHFDADLVDFTTTLALTSDLTTSVQRVERQLDDKADEFTPWVLTYVPPSEDIENFRVFDTHTDNILLLQHKDADPDVPGRIVWTDVGVGQYNEWDLSLDIISYGNLFTATRKRVLRTGDAATPQELPTAEQLLTEDQVKEIAKVKDKADEFTPWGFVANSPDVEPALMGAHPIVTFDGTNQWYISGLSNGFTQKVPSRGTNDVVKMSFLVWYEEDGTQGPITATRKRVLRTGDAATPQELTDAVLAEKVRATAVENGIIEQIDAFKAFDIRVMDALPDKGEVGVIYLVRADDYATTKTRDEYLWSDATTNFNLIGSTRFDSSMIAKTKTTTPIPPDKTNIVSYVNMKEHGGVTMPEDEDGSVVIGKGAVGTIDPAHISTITNRTALRSASVAIGMNADATGGRDKSAVQSIAIGWNAKAKASNAIAIGSGAVHWFEDDETGPAAVASGGESIALGYEAKAKANQSMQIGRGVNGEANSLKFYDTWVVKDGKVQAGVDSNAVEKISRDMLEPDVFVGTDEEITVKSHAISTFAPTGYVEEVNITPTGSRNYEMYFPNTPEMRERLPVAFETDIEGDVTKLGPWWTNRILRLPAKVTMKEPLPKTLILEVEEYETGWDWATVVTRAYETNGYVRVEGTNLHFTASVRIGGVALPVKNPLYGVVNVETNGVSGVACELIGADGGDLATFLVE